MNRDLFLHRPRYKRYATVRLHQPFLNYEADGDLEYDPASRHTFRLSTPHALSSGVEEMHTWLMVV